MEWDWIDWENAETPKLEPVPVNYCVHQWKPILLIWSTVYDCVWCGKKKEECDKV